MIASVALRSRCCRYHAHFNGPDEHASCVVCDERMPLVKASLFEGVAEHICEACRPILRAQILRLLRAAILAVLRRPGAPRWLRGTLISRREPTTYHTTHTDQRRKENTR